MKVSLARGKRGARDSWVLGVALIIVCGVGYVFVQQSTSVEGSSTAVPTFEVREGPLLISIVESGTIGAREQRIVKSEVEGQHQITWLIPEGEYVKEGDLLVELDSGSFEYKLLTQQIDTQDAEANLIEAQENLSLMRLSGESNVSGAELRAQFAAEDLVKYIDGDFPLDLKSAQVQVTLALAELASAERNSTAAGGSSRRATSRLGNLRRWSGFCSGVSWIWNWRNPTSSCLRASPTTGS